MLGPRIFNWSRCTLVGCHHVQIVEFLLLLRFRSRLAGLMLASGYKAASKMTVDLAGFIVRPPHSDAS